MSSTRLIKFNVIKTFALNLCSTKLKRPYSSGLADALKEFRIVPELIAEAPQNKIFITYKGNVTVKVGNILTPEQTKEQPPCISWQGNKNHFHTLYMCDMDQPSRGSPCEREWQNWLLGNIPGENVKQGVTMTPYIGPLPKKDTGAHRIVFLVFKHEKCIDFKEPLLTTYCLSGRGKFNIRKFQEKYRLEAPIAANYFLTENDCHATRQLSEFEKKKK